MAETPDYEKYPISKEELANAIRIGLNGWPTRWLFFTEWAKKWGAKSFFRG